METVLQAVSIVDPAWFSATVSLGYGVTLAVYTALVFAAGFAAGNLVARRAAGSGRRRMRDALRDMSSGRASAMLAAYEADGCVELGPHSAEVYASANANEGLFEFNGCSSLYSLAPGWRSFLSRRSNLAMLKRRAEGL